jgi:formamidopyrimidine-DNA glycosylase
MPELPDIEAYIRALTPRVVGKPLEKTRIQSPFLVRTVDPPLSSAVGKRVTGLRRLGKRIVFAMETDIFIVLHLMIAGRLHWRDKGAPLAGKYNLAAFDFPDGSLVLTEAGSKRRASLHMAAGEAGLAALDPGGIEPLECSEEEFSAAIHGSGHTLKRALTEPRLFSGIGNAYSDEILHRAKLSPVRLAKTLSRDEARALFEATRGVLREWSDRLGAEAEAKFPEKVTAFRKGFAVHGRYKEKCPECGAPVQRIVHGDNETNYCAHCQTRGKLLADRALSALLKKDWPKTLEEWEEMAVARARSAVPR